MVPHHFGLLRSVGRQLPRSFSRIEIADRTEMGSTTDRSTDARTAGLVVRCSRSGQIPAGRRRRTTISADTAANGVARYSWSTRLDSSRILCGQT